VSTFNRNTGKIRNKNYGDIGDVSPNITPSRHAPNSYQRNRTPPNGEMYAPPFPNPFTPEYAVGYKDGYEKMLYSPVASGGKIQNYRLGFLDGAEQLKIDEA
jgi:hypothetical protein